MENDLRSKVRGRGLRTLRTLHFRRFGDRGGDRHNRLRHVDTFLGDSIESTGKQVHMVISDQQQLQWVNFTNQKGKWNEHERTKLMI